MRRYREDPDVDYHLMVAEMTGLARGDAKNLNFGLAYGQGIPLLCANLGVDVPEGMRIMRTYHEKAPFVKPLAALASSQANLNAEITTLLGRKRRFNVWEKGNAKGGRMSEEENTNEYVSETNLGHFHHVLKDEQLMRSGWTEQEINDPERRGPDDAKYLRALRNNGWRRAFLHKALNALIQGSAADVMKKAMVECWESGVFDDAVLGAPHLTVHDELDGSMDPSNKAHVEALAHVKHVMETCVTLKVPLRADGGIGPNWGALE
jgi:DNA polymerase I-like protein with 3'-5' exonuclease and polymerase domains